MSPPREVFVGPRTYRLRVGGKHWRRLEKLYKNKGFLYGETKHSRPAVTVRPDLDPVIERATVLHEILHALINSAGDLLDRYKESTDGLEEFVCHVLEGPILALLRDNPLLVEYLTEET